MGYKDFSNLPCSRVLSLLILTLMGQAAHSTWSLQISHSCFCHGPFWFGAGTVCSLGWHKMPSPSGSTARPHHLCAFPVTAPGCVPCCEMPEAIRAAPATNPSRAAAAAPSLPASLLRRVGKLPPRPTLRRQQPVSRGGGAPTHDCAKSQAVPGCGEPRRYRGRSRCQGNGGGAPRRGGAERCGAERPRGRSGPGQVRAIRTALRRNGG